MKKTAIVTGGSRGIGYAVAERLGRDGCNVVIFATGPAEKYGESLEKLSKEGIAWHYVQGSLDSASDRERLVKEAIERFGRIDILVNNAGVAPLVRNDLLEMTEESFDRVVGINAKGTLFLTQLVAKQMIAQDRVFAGKGHIVNVGSCSAEVSSVSRGEYCVSKAAVSMLTTLFADRLAGEGIVVNEVRPGVIATDMTSVVKGKYDKLIEEGAFPIARWGQPEDVANVVAMFCSDQVLYTTGNYVDVDGGFHIKRL
ncbi:MAG: 3-ketoacyl-ACP reductase [Firmicutes bacterium]|nr:3-ketoacyl-ACP reductase [Bacillota bacterium]